MAAERARQAALRHRPNVLPSAGRFAKPDQRNPIGMTGMASIDTLFVSKLYRASLTGPGAKRLLADLEAASLSVAADDSAGQRWCEEHAYPGYTSYASLNDLPQRMPPFADLARRLDRHVAAFAMAVDFDLGGRKLVLDALWINVLEPGGLHSGHITVYVTIPPGASAIRFEDPRLGFLMAAPPRKARAAPENRTFVKVAPKPGTILLWESWLRHEVLMNEAESERVSVSFNYRWG
jgi:uncharacterized protein (TIGR02466 family)